MTPTAHAALATAIVHRAIAGAPRWPGDGPGVDLSVELRFEPDLGDIDRHEVWDLLTVTLRGRLAKGKALGYDVSDGALSCHVKDVPGAVVLWAVQRCHPPSVP